MNPVHRCLSGLCLATSLAIHISSLQAQIVNDGATNTLSNVTNSVAGNLTVGTNGSFTLLVLSDNATLTNSGFSTIGQNATAKSNEVRLVSPTARWFMGASTANPLFVGSNGAANRLVVSNGAIASVQANAYLGYISESASNNQVWVTGPNSVWSSAASIEVGFLGSGNQVVVSNGGTVLATNVILGDGTIASNNLALVTGPGSLWSSANLFYVGDDGSGNHLLVSEGGVVRSGFSRIGGALLSGSGNNLALITGSGSVWSNALDLEIGRSLGINNRLVVSNGASAFVGGNALVGITSGANSNSVLVTDPATRWLVATNLYLGTNGSFNVLIVSNGASSTHGIGFFSFNTSSSNNLAVITGTNSVMTNRSGLRIGQSGSGNRLLVSNGGRLQSFVVLLGFNASSGNNEATLTGPGSRWNASANVDVGTSGSGNRFFVTAGGQMRNTSANIGTGSGSSNNLAVVSDPGSSWTNFGALRVGTSGSRNTLVVSNQGLVFTEGVIVGSEASSTNNRSIVDGGILLASDAGVGALDIRRGTNVLNSGLIDADVLLVTNALGKFEFNGGTLRIRQSIGFNGIQLMRVGNGSSPALLVLVGNGGHELGSPLIVSANGALTGNGTILGSFSVEAGGLFSPGQSIGTISGTQDLLLQGTTLMDISRNGATVTNDLVLLVEQQGQPTNGIFYGGTLIVTNIGPDALAAGNRFRLFNCPAYAGSFTTISLPPLNPGLSWTNKLLLDGSIEVIGVLMPKFSSVAVSGTNVVISGSDGIAGQNYAVLTATNVTAPLSNWVGLFTNQFGAGGSFSFTNPIAPGELQRYFRIRTP